MKVSRHVFSLLLSGGMIIGCSESSDSTVSQAPEGGPSVAAPGMAAPTTPTAETGGDAAEPQIDPILEGLVEHYEDLPGEFAQIKGAYEKAATDTEAVGSYVGTLENLGMMHAQQGRSEVAAQAFLRAGDVLAKALDAGVVFESTDLASLVFYNQACVMSKQEKAQEALAVLNRAVENGFNNAEQLKSDKDLEAVRALPEYESQLAAWETHFAELEKKRKELLVQHAQEELAQGNSFPFDFDITDVNGKPLKLSELKGRVCIVDIWGTWCPPCRQEIPAFVQLQDKYGKYGFQMVGLNQERGPSDEANTKTVQEFIANNSVNYPCALIPDAVMAQVPEFQGFPTTLFIDHRGKVRLKSVGFHEYEYMAAVVESLLKEQASESRANTN
ncbi:MAG: redoxin domain-containing protein [Planctomycetaceae bacterium]|nr:redoxin domain-containing protein [Planctomycetaceae bacterium]